MALAVQTPDAGTLPVNGAIVILQVSELAGATVVANPTAGTLPVLGALVIGRIVAGDFTLTTEL